MFDNLDMKIAIKFKLLTDITMARFLSSEGSDNNRKEIQHISWNSEQTHKQASSSSMK